MSFPHGSGVDELDAIKADLALVDTWLAEPILLFVASGEWQEPVPDVERAFQQIRRAITSATTTYPTMRIHLDEYSRYLLNLEKVYLAIHHHLRIS
ncbi:MAG TPA: hypothetical protein VK139_03830 [Microbacteriaceae bacterium]|nr:hypothetical protein [Microbacteriaceae bacterium]